MTRSDARHTQRPAARWDVTQCRASWQAHAAGARRAPALGQGGPGVGQHLHRPGRGGRILSPRSAPPPVGVTSLHEETTSSRLTSRVSGVASLCLARRIHSSPSLSTASSDERFSSLRFAACRPLRARLPREASWRPTGPRSSCTGSSAASARSSPSRSCTRAPDPRPEPRPFPLRPRFPSRALARGGCWVDWAALHQPKRERERDRGSPVRLCGEVCIHIMICCVDEIA